MRADANLAHAIDTLTDGAFFNAGQSCCGIKRIYVAASRYEEFVAGVVDLTNKYRLGLAARSGNDARTRGAHLRRRSGPRPGARSRRPRRAPTDRRGDVRRLRPGTPYLAPQVLVDVDHSMAIMREETFGPAVGIMKVASDEEALRLMNDSDFGLTAAIFSDGCGACRSAGRCARNGHGISESVRLSRSRSRLDRRQKFGPRLHPVARRIRTADAAEVLSLQGDDMSITCCAAIGIIPPPSGPAPAGSANWPRPARRPASSGR